MSQPLPAQLTQLTQLNRNAAAIAAAALIDQSLRIEVVTSDKGFDGASVLNFAADGKGTIAAGLKLAEICMGGLGQVKVVTAAEATTDTVNDDLQLPRINVSTDHPLLACMAAQYAGWPLEGGEGENFFAMCSGPARSLRGQEKVLKEYGLVHSANEATGVLETSQLPPPTAVADFAKQCSVAIENVTLCIARTASIPGSLQVVARSVETALHKLHELEFDLATIKTGYGSAPLPPIPKDDLTALGWTNDAILYGSTVNLSVETSDEAIKKIIDLVPSKASNDFGTPFLDIFNSYEKDFYKIDKMLFSPAQITIHNVATGNTFQSGEIRNDILRSSYPNSTSEDSPLKLPHSDDAKA